MWVIFGQAQGEPKGFGDWTQRSMGEVRQQSKGSGMHLFKH